MDATRSEDAPNPSVYEEMDPERRRFLEEALRSMTIDVVDKLQHSMNILIDSNAPEEEQVQAIESVTDFIENIDTANDFYKIGGFCILIPCLNSPYPSVRQCTAELIGELAQNNPFCQKHLLDMNILPKLIELLTDEPSVSNTALHALSCIIRGFEPALKAFLDIGGVECLLSILESGQEKLVIKSTFLLSSLCIEDINLRDEIVNLEVVERLSKLIEPKSDYDTLTETVLSTLYVLTESKEAVARCQDPQLKLYSKLSEIRKLGEDKDEFQECIGYAEGIIQRCFSVNEDTDR